MRVLFIFTSVAKRRLTFLNKEGYDRFGKNKLFAPLMKWEAFKEEVKDIRDHAKSYEDAYNEIQGLVEQQNGIKQVLRALPRATKIQVVREKERLVEARRVAVSEKEAYVAVSYLPSPISLPCRYCPMVLQIDSLSLNLSTLQLDIFRNVMHLRS